MHLIGRYLDFGAAGIIIPQLETSQTGRDAIRSFYYPPLGTRSWGPDPDTVFGHEGNDQDFAYADWWNEHGILMAQLESIAGVLECKELALPRLDMLTFGPQDLSLDLRGRHDAPLASVEDCYAYVREHIADSNIPVAGSNTPMGVM